MTISKDQIAMINAAGIDLKGPARDDLIEEVRRRVAHLRMPTKNQVRAVVTAILMKNESADSLSGACGSQAVNGGFLSFRGRDRPLSCGWEPPSTALDQARRHALGPLVTLSRPSQRGELGIAFVSPSIGHTMAERVTRVNAGKGKQ
jgi:hypothetical protein